MIQLPNDVWFIVAGWGVILGGLALYAISLLRRLDASRRELRRPGTHAAGERE